MSSPDWLPVAVFLLSFYYFFRFLIVRHLSLDSVTGICEYWFVGSVHLFILHITLLLNPRCRQLGLGVVWYGIVVSVCGLGGSESWLICCGCTLTGGGWGWGIGPALVGFRLPGLPDIWG